MTEALYRNAYPRPGGYRDAEPLQLEEHLEDAHLVDVREAHEFSGELGHISGADLVPLGTLAIAARSWDKAEPIVVVCRSGARAGNAARQLVQLGFQKVINLRGGMLAWHAARRPVERTPVKPRPPFALRFT
ncbi:MAG TPA: rhodanese-like domain-containing protein [Polyangiaceae bacterium]